MGTERVALALSSAIMAAACGAGGGTQSAGRASITEVTSAPLRSCDLPDERSDAPTFELDSAQLSDRGRDVLARIAACRRDGRLGRGKLVLIGFADPRGSSSYNQQLGLYRALAAREALVSFGVPESALVVATRGEREAVGHDERGWALDRRVEVRIGE